MFKVNNEDTKMKSVTFVVVFIVNFENISHPLLVFYCSPWTDLPVLPFKGQQNRSAKQLAEVFNCLVWLQIHLYYELWTHYTIQHIYVAFLTSDFDYVFTVIIKALDQSQPEFTCSKSFIRNNRNTRTRLTIPS